MRKVITGLDAAGRSCVIDETPLTLKAARSGAHQLAILYNSDSAPPQTGPPAEANPVDVGLGSGVLRWLMIHFEAEAEFGMHRTDTIDCVAVLDGSVELGLDDGWHLLESGDCVVIPGVDHAWKAGPNGCRLSVSALGTPPVSSGK